MEELVTLLKAFRERAGLSQNELSVKSGLSETYYGKIENELRRPSTGALLHILQALGCLPHEQEQAVRLFTAARFPGLLESLTPRPQPGTAGAVVPSPKRPLARRRRLLGWVWACASAGSLLSPLRGVEARPITDRVELRAIVADLRDSVARRRRWALA